MPKPISTELRKKAEAQLKSTELRKKAEAQLKSEAGDYKVILSDENTKRMLHELEVHQIELETQNEELQQARIAQRRASQRYTELFEFAPIAYFSFDLNGIINQTNFRGATLLGMKRADLVGKQFSHFVTAQYRDIFKRFLVKASGGGGIHSCEILVQVNNNPFWLNIEANINITGVNCFAAVMDITERKKSEITQNLAAGVFTHASESIIITDVTSTIIDVNEAFTGLTGYSHEEAIGNSLRMLESGRHPPEFYYDLDQTLLKEGAWSGEIWSRRKNGDVYAEMRSMSAVCDEQGIITHYIALGSDITQIKEHQSQLEHIAYYDTLTHLPNRVLLSDRLSHAMLQCNRHKQSLAVAFLDLDGFKAVNDTYGHSVGDELLIAISIRMKEALREGDSLARFGGDEFIVVLADLVNVDDCKPVLERLLLAASEPITVGDVVFNVSASIGVTLYPEDNVDADKLMRHADQAMYVAKQLGKNRYHLFDKTQDEVIKVKQASLEAIRSALANQQFVLYYQPKVNMRTGSVVGFEALIRWQHPEKGLLTPDDFLPVIENHPMSIEIGEWVIDSALAQISQWQAMGLNLPLRTSINIGAVQLQQPDFTQRLITLLAAHPDVEPRYLSLEVLETSAINDVQHVSTIMNACMALGVNFALDDFGTGYSSLTYLRQLPATVIKIDQSFVQDMLTDEDDLAIVEGVIALAHSFKREVIAEGVETIEHGTALLQLGCELAQGYGIARPMPASDITAWIRDWTPDVGWKT